MAPGTTQSGIEPKQPHQGHPRDAPATVAPYSTSRHDQALDMRQHAIELGVRYLDFTAPLQPRPPTAPGTTPECETCLDVPRQKTQNPRSENQPGAFALCARRDSNPYLLIR